MAKLNIDKLMELLDKAKSDKELLAKRAAAIIANHGVSGNENIVTGNIGVHRATKVEAIIEEIVEKFKAQKTFNWRVHVLDVVDAVIEIVKTVGDYSDRQQLEVLVVDIVSDLFRTYNPKIPYLPGFIGNWVKGLLVKTVVPAAVDWLLDKTYGDD